MSRELLAEHIRLLHAQAKVFQGLTEKLERETKKSNVRNSEDEQQENPMLLDSIEIFKENTNDQEKLRIQKVTKEREGEQPCSVVGDVT